MGWRQLANYNYLSHEKKNKLLAATLQISLENNTVMVLKTAEIIAITLGFIVGRKIEHSL